MADKLRWGILSTANIGRRRVSPAIQQSSNGEVVAVASRSLEKAQAYAGELKIAKAYGSYEELIAADDVDAIYNPLPNSLHAEWSIKCAEAGKPTLCEKPLASNADEAQKMVNAFAERSVPLAEAFMYRFHPQTEQVRKMLENGAIGELKLVSAAFTFGVSDEENIRLSKPLAGGSLMDVGCYCLNAMRYMVGEEPESVEAFVQIGEATKVDEAVSAIISFPSGVLGHFDCGLRTQNVHTYELRGTEGRILVEEAFTPSDAEETYVRHWRGEHYLVISVPATNQYKLMVEDFADAVLKKRPPRFGPEDAVKNMQVIDKVLASATAEE